MTQEQWTVVDDYLSRQLAKPDLVLDATLENSANAGMPAINVAPNQGQLLNLLARIRGARRILEIGALGGYSTIWLARALPPDGKLITLELDPDHAALARNNIDAAGLSNRASVIIGKATDTLKKLVADKTKPFDLIFIDADKENYPEYLKQSLKLASPGAVIIGDNVVRGGRVADANNNDPDVCAIRDFLKLMATEPRLTSTAIQTVGVKGWDGFSISVVSK